MQSYGGFLASEGVVVDSDGYREYALTGLEVYQGGSTEPPKYDPRFAVALNAFNATPIGEGLPTKWEAVIERVYYRGEAEFLQAFMPDVPPPFTIHLSGPQQ